MKGSLALHRVCMEENSLTEVTTTAHMDFLLQVNEAHVDCACWAPQSPGGPHGNGGAHSKRLRESGQLLSFLQPVPGNPLHAQGETESLPQVFWSFSYHITVGQNLINASAAEAH